MSFSFSWPHFSDQFHHDAIQMLNNALNKGSKPPVIADKIEVVELHMGTQPPELEIRDIGDLAVDHFRGIFRLTYAGDAHLVLKTKVQANPLNHKQPDIHLMTGSRGILAAKQPLVVPMLLRLSHFRLSSYVVLVVSKQKGITLVFKTDPLQNVDINSTFDSIGVIQKFIQREIEGQLRQMFREDLPGSSIAQRPESVGVPRPRSISGMSSRSANNRTPKPEFSAVSTSKASPTTAQLDPFSDIENYDPTYGLRPEGLPIKSGFRHFSSLFTPNNGLAGLQEEPSDADADDDDEVTSFDMMSPPPSVEEDRETEYETTPAVGGGTITRPRIIHAQSSLGPLSAGPSMTSRHSSPLYNPYFSEAPYSAPPFRSSHNDPAHDELTSQVPPGPFSTTSEEVSVSSQSPPYTFSPGTSPPSEFPSATLSTSPPNNPKIVLRPSLMTNSIRHLSTLSHSNHTLSPYTRSLAHFTPVKAKRKRTYRLGGTNNMQQAQKDGRLPGPTTTTDHDVPTTRPSSPPPPSEFDASDMDLYFRSHDDSAPSNRQTPSAVHRLRQRHHLLFLPRHVLLEASRLFIEDCCTRIHSI
ncbi:hypothetical protein F5887DRAFT_1065058 [Amanita rubescens]|nr:hypothetical protein F5887DRAFT_1065058 [Amanita rubescens]